MAKIEIIIDGKPNSIEYTEKDRDSTNAEIILNIIQKIYKNTTDEQIEFIRYLNPEYDAWVLLKKDDEIQIRNGLKILVKLEEGTFNENQLLKKKNIIGKISDLNKKIDKELSKLQNKQKIEDLRPSRTFNLNNTLFDKEKELDNSSTIDDCDDDNDLVDIIVLTANPLIDKNKKNNKIVEEKELRTMNDFNSIAHSICNVILNECNKQIKAQFLPLTKKNLKLAISKRPKILHLLCQSVYESESDTYKTYLFFENENCEVDRESRDDLEKLINSKDLLKIDKDIISGITLLVSTPLSEDIFNIFKKFNFKNIMVQHTTLANIDFISELNEQLYLNIIKLNKPIIDAFEVAKKNSINVKHQFCCCFHEHKDDCKFKENLSNELYPKDENNNQIKYYFIIPHFYHLRYKCKCNNDDSNFCSHKGNCENSGYCFKPLHKGKDKNLCCCEKLKKEHDLKHIFFCTFSENDEEGIFSNYQNNNFGKIINREFLPNYNKMNFLVGRNRIIYNIFDLLRDSKYNIINVHGKQYKDFIYKIDKLIDMIIEFLKERIPYYLHDEENNEGNFDSLSLKKRQTSIFKNNKFQIIKDKMKSKDSSNFLNLNLETAESAPTINKMPLIPKYQKMYFYVDNHENISSIINNMKNIKNTVFFINGYKISVEDLLKIFNQNEFYQSKIVLFTENKLTSDLLENNKEKYKIQNIEFNSLTKEDYEIRLQNKKIESKREIFNSEVKQIESSFSEKTIDLGQSINISIKDEEGKEDKDKDEKRNNLNYELLFLFNCSNSGLFEMEMIALYPNNYRDVTYIIEKKYIPIKIINKIENQEKEVKFTRYKRNQNLFKEYYKTREMNIPNKIKQLLLKKLFQFYAKAFRLLINQSKLESEDIIGTKTKVKKYKPNKSLTSFSAIQELGMWLPFEKNDNNPLYNFKLISIIGYFKHLLRNFKDIFKDENIRLCSKNKEVWRNVSENIEDISITLLTLTKMFSLNENKLITLFEDTLKKEDHFIHSSYLRFKLFDCMSYEYSYEYSNIKKDTIKKLEEIEKEYKNIGYLEGELETLFAECIVYYRKNKDLEKFKDIYQNQIKVKLELIINDCNLDNKKRFVTLFGCKVKYKYIKYKIKLCILINDELLELKQVLKDFIEVKYYFYVIKTCFLISEWHLKKKEYENRNGKEESDEELQKHIDYLNFAYYLSILCSNQRYLYYSRNYIKKYYKNCIQKKEKNPEIKAKLKLLCKEFNAIINEGKLDFLYYDY